MYKRMFQDSETRLFCGKERDVKIAMSCDQDTITYGFNYNALACLINCPIFELRLEYSGQV